MGQNFQNQTPVLEVRNITKRFRGVVANSNVNLKLYQGEILGLLGDCLLYTSDAADDLLCVGLGGRRIIKKNRL